MSKNNFGGKRMWGRARVAPPSPRPMITGPAAKCGWWPVPTGGGTTEQVGFQLALFASTHDGWSSLFDLHRPSSPPQATAATTTVAELQEQLFAREKQLTLREENLVVREAGIEVSEQALGKVSLELDSEWAKTESTRQGYLEKHQAHTASMKHTLGLGKLLEETKVLL
jgi:hypothetical protein